MTIVRKYGIIQVGLNVALHDYIIHSNSIVTFVHYHDVSLSHLCCFKSHNEGFFILKLEKILRRDPIWWPYCSGTRWNRGTKRNYGEEYRYLVLQCFFLFHLFRFLVHVFFICLHIANTLSFAPFFFCTWFNL